MKVIIRILRLELGNIVHIAYGIVVRVRPVFSHTMLFGVMCYGTSQNSDAEEINVASNVQCNIVFLKDIGNTFVYLKRFLQTWYLGRHHHLVEVV